MSHLLARFTAALQAHGCRGRGRDWQCPSHDDRRASLSVTEGTDGCVIVKCHGGCATEDVVGAVGWKMSDLFPANGSGRGGFTIDATYRYADEAGNLLFEVVRSIPKDFRQRRPDGEGGWIWDLRGVPRVPYHLPALIEGVRRGETVYVLEGEKDVEAVERAGGVATCNPGGAGKWRAEYSPHFRGARVRIVADDDAPGIKHARHVAASLRFVAASLEIVKAASGKDAYDHLSAGRGLGDFLLLEDATASENDRPSAVGEAAGTRPKIVVRGELLPVCDEAEAALLNDSSSGLFTRARILVRVVRCTRHQKVGLRRPKGAPYIEAVSIDSLRERLDRAAMWVSRKEVDGVFEERPALPPMWAARVLAARGEWPFPPLEGLTEVPTMRPDGSIVDEPGYDTSSGLFYVPSDVFPRVPAEPTPEDAKATVETLLDPLADFPFVGEGDRAAALAAVLTLLGRFAIPGPVPCFAVRAPTPGTGKTLLVDVISIIATGRAAARMTVPKDDDEGRKRILSIGLDGTPIVLLDNIDGALGSASLAAALTGTEFADRLLGVSKIVRAPMRAVWFATGNGLTFKGDLGRRVVPIDLDPRVEHPEDRQGFRYPNLLTHVRSERPKLVVAALTILRAFHLAGRPSHGKPRVGTFEEWDELIRGAMVWVGLEDPVKGRERVREEGDADLDSIREVYLAWHGAFGEGARTTAEAIAAATTGESNSTLRSALAALDPRGDGSKLNPRVIGEKLKRWKGRVVEGLMLESAGKAHGAVLWRVKAPPANPGPETGEGSRGERGSQHGSVGDRDGGAGSEGSPGSLFDQPGDAQREVDDEIPSAPE